tara:strand:+ start:254 stop:634 length:381 start_codon:yes stop_codon:yes gene_type:complete
MKILNINLQERVLWILGLGLLAFFTEHQMIKVSSLETIINTYELESNIQASQFHDLSQQLIQNGNSEYLKGFEAGKTQAGVAFINGDSLYNYADGYHQALSQFSEVELTEDEALDKLINAMIKNDE